MLSQCHFNFPLTLSSLSACRITQLTMEMFGLEKNINHLVTVKFKYQLWKKNTYSNAFRQHNLWWSTRTKKKAAITLDGKTRFILQSQNLPNFNQSSKGSLQFSEHTQARRATQFQRGTTELFQLQHCLRTAELRSQRTRQGTDLGWFSTLVWLYRCFPGIRWQLCWLRVAQSMWSNVQFHCSVLFSVEEDRLP